MWLPYYRIQMMMTIIIIIPVFTIILIIGKHLWGTCVHRLMLIIIYNRYQHKKIKFYKSKKWQHNRWEYNNTGKIFI